MKRIVKNEEPSSFADWKADDKMAHRPRWKRVSQSVRVIVHESLLDEQGAICCYCERPITASDSHVEHFRPKKHFKQDQLNYQNLLCSCGRDEVAGEPRHCGHRKGSWFEENLLVSPLAHDCEGRFRFTGDGQIHAADGDQAAATTISRLGLNLPKLQALRVAALEALADTPATDIRRLLAVPTREGYHAFFTTIRQILT